MQNKKSKKTKESNEQESHIFEIHTMQSDIEEAKQKQLKSASQKSKKDTSKTAQKPPAVPTPTPMQQNNVQKPITQSQETNPFLSKESDAFTKKASDLNQEIELPEKINQVPGDIVFDEGSVEEKPLKNQKAPKKKKSMSVVIIIIIILILFAAAAFGVFMLQTNKQADENIITQEEQVNEDIVNTIEENIEEDMQEIQQDAVENVISQTYSVSLPNYFAIDIESETSESDIAAELELIANNMIKEDVEGPISFIVTDVNNNPVAFHVFAISAGMTIPQDILSALEEEFEIYAYNDERLGVRFGFAIEAKDTETLNTAMLANEAELPKAFDLILNGLGASATDVVFNDSVYETHPIRYYNLNELEMYSIDYTINDMQLILGSSKITLRKIIDYLKNTRLPETTF